MVNIRDKANNNAEGDSNHCHYGLPGNGIKYERPTSLFIFHLTDVTAAIPYTVFNVFAGLASEKKAKCLKEPKSKRLP